MPYGAWPVGSPLTGPFGERAHAGFSPSPARWSRRLLAYFS